MVQYWLLTDEFSPDTLIVLCVLQELIFHAALILHHRVKLEVFIQVLLLTISDLIATVNGVLLGICLVGLFLCSWRCLTEDSLARLECHSSRERINFGA